MSEAPERIWTDDDGYWSAFDPSEARTVVGEYLRADLAAEREQVAYQRGRDEEARQWRSQTFTVDERTERERKLVEALKWYGEQARLCRLIHSEGDAGRHNLSDDGGERARAVGKELGYE